MTNYLEQMRALKEQERQSRKVTVMLWVALSILCCGMLILLLGCARPEVRLLEDQIRNPAGGECSCKSLTYDDLDNFLLVGKHKLAQMTDRLNQCAARGWIEGIE